MLLTLACHFYLEAFLPPVLGAMPFPVAGAFAAVFSLAAQLALAALVGLCFYRPFHHFSDRGPSAFLWGMCLVTLALCAVGNGKVDFLFRLHIPAQRLLVASLLFAAVIFVFRSVYQAGRFRQGATEDSLRAQMLTLKAGDYTDTLAAVQAAKAAQKAGEYALDTVTVMLADGLEAQVPGYIAAAQEQRQQNPILAQYHENPYLNAVIATKAAFAAQNQIDFQCSAATGNAPLKTAELCVIVNELLTRACQEAAAYQGPGACGSPSSPGRTSCASRCFTPAKPPRRSPPSG